MKASVRGTWSGERVIVTIIAVLLVTALAITPRDAAAQQWSFSLAAGQSVTVGNYTVQFLGLTGRYASYDVYRGGSLFARFPSDPPPPNLNPYYYQNIVIDTTTIAPDGSAVAGTFTAR